ncbi:MAG: DUF5939 domain-containing protein, partial [Myxococcota bacterium]
MRVELEGRLTDPRIAWNRLGDTDFLNRKAGGGAVRMRIEPGPDGTPTVLGEMDGLLGTKMSFVERDSAWVYRRWFRQERAYARSPIARTAFRLELAPTAGGVVPRLALELEPASRVFSPAVAARASLIRSRWRELLDRLPAPGEPDRGEVLRTLGPDAAAAFDRWAEVAPRPIVAAIRTHLGVARELELTRLRPFALADAYALDRHETLVAMLHAVGAGALELYFSVRCGRCSGEVAATKTLSNLADHADCPSCRVSFAPDLAETVEVLFAPHPAVVPR